MKARLVQLPANFRHWSLYKICTLIENLSDKATHSATPVIQGSNHCLLSAHCTMCPTEISFHFDFLKI